MGEERTNETAVMVDTFRPLRVTDAARTISAPEYAWSWSGGTGA
jgi:homogentisate 1,2-dioxygenase